MYRLIQRLAAQHSLTEALSNVVEELQALVPAAGFAVYTPTSDGIEFEATIALGSYSQVLRGRRARLGEKIIGWSASSGRSVLNADPLGEFGESARVDGESLRSCLVVPLSVESERAAIFAAFSTRENGFRSEDQRIVEAVLRHIAPIIHRLRPGATQARSEGISPATLELTPVAMLACRCLQSDSAGDPVGMALAVLRRHLGTRALTHIINGNDIFVGVGIQELERIETTVEVLRVTLAAAGLIDKAHHVTFAVTPRDGTNLEHLLYSCRQRLSRSPDTLGRVH